MRAIGTAWLGLLMLASTAAAQVAAVGEGPEPSPNPVSWEFEFKFLDPRRIEVQLPGRAQPETFWYLVYTVTNVSDNTQRFFPTFQIVTDDLRVVDTDMGIGLQVFEAIREQHRVTHRYLVPPTQAIGDLLTGADNSRESVAIWRDVDLTQEHFRIFVSGLSGEARLVANRAYDASKPETEKLTLPDGRTQELNKNPKFFTLRKTLEIQYRLPGSAGARGRILPERESVRWVLR